jgi:hypothetical protein
VVAALIHADDRTDGRTDERTEMTLLIGSFCDFANAPKTKLACSHTALNLLSYLCMKCEFLTAVSGKITFLHVVTPCSPFQSNHSETTTRYISV